MAPETMRFSGKVAIVTGGTRGIGLATAERLGSEGARIVIADINHALFATAEKKILSAGSPGALMSDCNVAEPADVERVVHETIERFGQLDIIVNNAGLMVFKPIEELTLDDWLGVLRVDLLGAFLFIKQGFLCMRPGGTVVNVSSIHAVETEPRVSPYAAAKAALLSLTRSAALEGKPRGIRVTAVLPGAVDTPMLWSNPNVKAGVEKIISGDVGKPEDVASAIAFLASSDAAFVQGAALRVDGGRLGRL
jgi:NAD(P)-dependent dehydrogenase (short-subunit alcohol dehydrogenase family)